MQPVEMDNAIKANDHILKIRIMKLNFVTIYWLLNKSI